ncbi:MAG: transporter substrate-binding domain-containing protein [Lachnospiraceae bacterium]|nr:transporter substrate-binding domain-containing protein [Lachnospiraceae bacterium]
MQHSYFSNGSPVSADAYISYGRCTKKTVRVGFFPFDGYHMESENGTKSGYGYDILQQMYIYENWTYEYVGYKDNASWQEVQEMLESGEIDLLTSATLTEERQEIFEYSDLPIGYSSTRITIKAGDNRYDTDDYSQWNGARVGMLANNSRNDSFAAYATEHGFTYKAVEADVPDELVEMLKNGDIDMIVTSNLLKLDDVWTLDQFDEKPFYVIVKKGNTALLREVNDALGKIQESNPSFKEDLYKKYYSSDTGGVIAFTKEEQKFIEECNKNGITFQALVNPDRKPLSYYGEGRPKGLLVDICQEIFARTGLDIQMADVDNRDEYVSKFQSSSESIICDFTDSYGAAENMGYMVTGVYYTSSASKLIRKGYSGAGNRCAVVRSSIANKVITNRPGEENVAFDTMEECKDAVLNGDVDFAYMYTRNAQEMVYADVTNSLAVIPAVGISVSFSIAVNNQENALLASIIKKSIDSITETDISYLSEPYTYYDGVQTSLIGFIYDYPVVLIGLLAIFFIILLGIVLICINRRERKRERAVNEKLSAALKSAEQANQAKTEFLSRMSHDIRTPMNAIIGMTALARDEEASKQIQTYLGDIDSSSHFLLGLVNDILDLSKIESGELKLKPEPYTLEEFKRNITAVIQPLMRAKKIDFTYYADTLNGCILADKLRMNQIVFNLLSNSAKFTPEGGSVELILEHIADMKGKYGLRMVVRDSGIGISEEFLPHIFEPFIQEKTNENASNQGTGLGLSIVKHLVEEMEGSISVKSRLGEGTEFTVDLYFPLADGSCVAESEEIEVGTKLEDCEVLLVEDNDLNIRVASRVLEKAGCSVTIAKNGADAVTAFLESEEGFYDIILMDIRMPIMDGLEATRKIRDLSRKDAMKVPIIAMTADAFLEEKKKTIEAGMNYHLSKPIEPKKLYETLVKFMETK